MAPTAEIVELKSELQSIERQIDELLQRHSVLCYQLASLEPGDTQRFLVSNAGSISASSPAHLLISSQATAVVTDDVIPDDVSEIATNP
ncbi:hypothetical protein ABVT39_012672 [Epinephelus coioides]